MSWEELLEPNNAALATTALVSTTAVYGLYKNDWGAKAKTNRELEDYIEESSSYRPIQFLKSNAYKKEIKDRKNFSYRDL